MKNKIDQHSKKFLAKFFSMKSLSMKSLLMRCLLPLKLASLMSLASFSHSSLAVTATIDANTQSAPISPYIYGQFLEHIGGLVNTNIWSEMLVDRKFYYPVEAHPAEINEGPEWRKMPIQRWVSLGGDAAVTMDKQNAYAGEQTPVIHLDAQQARGFQQSGLSLVQGRHYSGRLVMASSGVADVSVSLVWGDAPNDRQTIHLKKITKDFKKFPFELVANANTENARIEITAVGKGDLKVGATSLMPADNIKGFRADVVAALKQLHSGIYRFPGGNFLSSHDWRNAVGDIDQRPPIMDPVWNSVQQNDVGTDEFLTLCDLLGVDAYISVNAGFGDDYSAAQLVEYVNGSEKTLMGQWRAKNGHAKAYNVKYWGIGNEPWGDWQMGFMPAAQYVIKHNLFAKAMKKVDPSIKLIGAGAMPDAMTGSKQAQRLNGQIVPDYLSKGDWSGNLLLYCLDNMDLLSEHYYSRSGQHTDLTKGDKVPTGPETAIEWARHPATQVRSKYEHYQEYLQRIPALKNKPIPISLDEWAYIAPNPNSFKVVPAYAWAFHEMFRHSDLYQLGAFTFATAMMSSNKNNAVLNPTGLMFKLYRDHFGELPVAVKGDSPQPAPIYPAGGDQPKVNPGSDTYPLDVVAAFTTDKKYLSVAVLNPSDQPQKINLNWQGVKLLPQGHLWRMAPQNPDASIIVDKAAEVTVEASDINQVPNEISVPAYSVNIYQFEVGK